MPGVLAATRTCKGCSQDLPLLGEIFRPQSSRPGLFQHRCRPCELSRYRDKAHALAALRPPKPVRTEKRCPKCGETKPVSEFGPTKSRGLRARCRSCHNEDGREYDHANAIAVRARKRAQKYKKRFNLTLDQVDTLWASVDYRCEACGIHKDETHNKALVIDHDHNCCPTEVTCGKCVRGILCTRCNVGLGALGDSRERVRGLLQYISGR